MSLLGYSLILLGIFWLSWATFLPPLVSALLCSLGHALGLSQRELPLEPKPLHLAVLIPAHNEATVILKTLESVKASAERYLSHTQGAGAQISVILGLDHCTDQTESLARSFFSAAEREQKGHPLFWHLIQNEGKPSKWIGLQNLVQWARKNVLPQKGAWVLFLDSGSVLDPDFLVAASKQLKSDVLGVAPCYMPAQAGRIEKFHWKIEQTLKAIENRSGGPITVHGAGVLYSLDHLEQVLIKLEAISPDTVWLNDDVVIPLLMRSLFSQKKMIYLKRDPAWITDVGLVSETQVELRRRSRMLIGNLQWVVLIWMSLIKSPVAFLLASRRVARMLWAYSLLSLALGVLITFVSLTFSQVFSSEVTPVVTNEIATSEGLNLVLLLALAILGSIGAVLISTSNFFRRVAMAFVAGLAIPKLGYSFYKNRSISWI